MTPRVLAAVVPVVLVLTVGCSSSATPTEDPTTTAPTTEHNMDNMEPTDTMPMGSSMPMNH